MAPASAADAPKRAADAPALEAEFVNEWERAFVRDSTITLHLRSYYLNRETTIHPRPCRMGRRRRARISIRLAWQRAARRPERATRPNRYGRPLIATARSCSNPGSKATRSLARPICPLKLWDQVFTGYPAARRSARSQFLRHPDDPEHFRRIHARRQGPRYQLHDRVSRPDETHQRECFSTWRPLRARRLA